MFCATTRHQEPASIRASNTLGVENLGRPKCGGVWEAQGRMRRERKRRHGESFWAWRVVGFDALEILEKVPLNRHED